jgi:hypothetical protein
MMPPDVWTGLFAFTTLTLLRFGVPVLGIIILGFLARRVEATLA